MPEPQIDAVVCDVPGTLVDEPAGLRAGIRALGPGRDPAEVERLLTLWRRHIERETGRVRDGAPPTPPATPSTWRRPASSRRRRA